MLGKSMKHSKARRVKNFGGRKVRANHNVIEENFRTLCRTNEKRVKKRKAKSRYCKESFGMFSERGGQLLFLFFRLLQLLFEVAGAGATVIGNFFFFTQNARIIVLVQLVHQKS